MSDKPTVHFDMGQPYSVTTGGRAWVAPIDHPSDRVSNTTMVQTSVVERVHCEKDQVFFETANSYYRGIHITQREG